MNSVPVRFNQRNYFYINNNQTARNSGDTLLNFSNSRVTILGILATYQNYWTAQPRAY